MPTLSLRVESWVTPITVTAPDGTAIPIDRVRLLCVTGLPGRLSPLDAVIDMGAPFTIVPQPVWRRLREGTDYEWLPFAPGAVPPPANIAGRTFTYRIARFIGPVDLMDRATVLPRTEVIVQFADGNPTSRPNRSDPLIVIGLWGGLLEGSRLHIDRDPATGRLTGALEFL